MEYITTSNYQITDQNSGNLSKSFLQFIDTPSKRTLDTYKRALKRLFSFFSLHRITEPTRADILDYKRSLEGDGLKNTTISTYITVTRLFFRWTAQEGIYPNIADHIKGEKISREHKKDYLTAGQASDVLNGIDTTTAAGKRDFAIVLLMTTCGLRTIEVARADIEDIRAAGDQTLLYVQGKGRSDKGDFVRLPQITEKAIREYLKTRPKASASDPLFTSNSRNNAGGRMTTRAISGIAKSAMKQAGYTSERLTAHSLRHTAVTLALIGGATLQEAQQFARHTDISTTTIYAHNLDKMNNVCADTIAAALTI